MSNLMINDLALETKDLDHSAMLAVRGGVTDPTPSNAEVAFLDAKAGIAAVNALTQVLVDLNIAPNVVVDPKTIVNVGAGTIAEAQLLTHAGRLIAAQAAIRRSSRILTSRHATAEVFGPPLFCVCRCEPPSSFKPDHSLASQREHRSAHPCGAASPATTPYACSAPRARSGRGSGRPNHCCVMILGVKPMPDTGP